MSFVDAFVYGDIGVALDLDVSFLVAKVGFDGELVFWLEVYCG